MIKLIDYFSIINDESIKNAHINNGFIGFKEDYLVIHCLLKQWQPTNIFEVGTANGEGCLVFKTALPDIKITTIDINYGPTFGRLCPVDTTMIVGDSTNYDYTKHSEDKYELYQVINPPYTYSSFGKCITRVMYAIKNKKI